MLPNDTILLAQIKMGNKAAADDVFRKYYPDLLLHAFSMVGDTDEAKDVVQQCFAYILAHEKLSAIKSSLKGYLHTVVHNECLKSLQKKAKVSRDAELWKISASVVEYPNLDLEDESAKNIQEIAREMATLPMRQQESLRLVHYQGQAYDAAAAQMGVSVNTLKTHLRLAVAAIRKKLA